MNERLIKRRWLEEAKSERLHWLSQDIETGLDELTSTGGKSRVPAGGKERSRNGREKKRKRQKPNQQK